MSFIMVSWHEHTFRIICPLWETTGQRASNVWSFFDVNLSKPKKQSIWRAFEAPPRSGDVTVMYESGVPHGLGLSTWLTIHVFPFVEKS